MMLNKMKREQGSSLVEVALMIPVLLVLLLATFDIGNGFTTFIALSNAAREGARWLSLNPNDNAGALTRIATEAGQVGLASGSYTPTITVQPDGTGNTSVTVLITYPYPMLFGALLNPFQNPVSGPAIPATITFRTQATMRVLFSS